MLKVVTPPDEMITTDDVEGFARVTLGVSEIAMVEGFVTAAREWAEEYLGRAIGVQTLELRIAGFPDNNGPIILRAPLDSVTSVKYLDSDGVETTLDAADYIVSDAEPGVIVPVSSWPADYGTADAVRVVYRAGYDQGSPLLTQALPKTIRTAMLMTIADMYANREAQVEKVLQANPTLERLISMYRLNMGI